MKELTTEQNMNYEKKYKEALEWARKVMQGKVGFVLDEVLEKFPELKESKENEDERIRKIIKQSLESYFDGKLSIGTNDVDYAICLSWLRKQGEKESNKIPIWKHWKNGVAGNEGDKLIYLVKMNDTYRLTSALAFECDYIELSELDSFMFEKQGEPANKVAVWSNVSH